MIKEGGLISVIVPIYNSEKYLEECIRSIFNQTYKNLEILLIDDGSTDNSGNICNKFSEEDNRIKVVHKRNCGIASARNCGILHSTGDYISFIDSDDCIASDFYEILLSVSQKYDADISIIKETSKEDEIYIKHRIDNQCINIFKQKQAIKKLLDAKPFHFEVWNRLYKKNIIKLNDFPHYYVGEDALATLEFFKRSKKIVFIDCPKYYYRPSETGVTRQKINDKKLDIIIVLDILLEEIRKNYPDLTYKMIAKKVYFYAHLIKQMLDSGYDDIKNYKMMLNYIRNHIKEVYKGKYTVAQKIFVTMIAINPRITTSLINIIC